MSQITEHYLLSFEELDSEQILDSIVAKVKRVSPYLFVYPSLYKQYYNAKTEEEKEKVRERTPLITNEDYIFLTAHLFSEEMKRKDWGLALMGPRIVFYNPQIESFFKTTNANLLIYLGIMAIKIGVPSRLTGSPNFVKSTLGTLKQNIKIENKLKNLEK